MNNRIRELRKDQKLTQEEFAKKLGLTKNYISLIETGDREPSVRTILDICAKFDVSEDWLKNGKGERYNPKTKNDIISEFVNKVMKSKSDDFKKRLISALSQLDEVEWKVLEDLANNLR